MNVEPRVDLTESQFDDLLSLYRREWWSANRERDDVVGMLDESDEMVALYEADSGALVAFARVLTDYVYKALLMDVIVAEPYRGTGLGARSMDEVVAHPSLRVDHLDLACVTDQVPFYERWGFTDDLGDTRLMRRERA